MFYHTQAMKRDFLDAKFLIYLNSEGCMRVFEASLVYQTLKEMVCLVQPPNLILTLTRFSI